MTPLKSSNLKGAHYDPAKRALTVHFHSGDAWTFANVPHTVHAGLMAADSPGEFFHANVKGKFESVKQERK